MGVGLLISPGHKAEAHALSSSQERHNSPSAEFCCIICDLTRQAHSSHRVQVSHPTLSLFIPGQQGVQVHVLPCSRQVRMHRAPDANSQILRQFEKFVLVTHFGVDLILIFDERVFFLQVLRFIVSLCTLLDSGIVKVAILHFCCFLHEWAHTVDWIIVDWLLVISSWFATSLPVQHVRFLARINEDIISVLTHYQVPRVVGLWRCHESGCSDVSRKNLGNIFTC